MNVIGPLPRSVLDLADSEFYNDDDSSGENSWPSYGHGFDSDEVMGHGRERVKELALDRMVVRWESGGWEVVRSAGEPGSMGDREGGGICREYLDCLGWELEEWSGNDGEASWGGYPMERDALLPLVVVAVTIAGVFIIVAVASVSWDVIIVAVASVSWDVSMGVVQVWRLFLVGGFVVTYGDG